MRNLGVDIKQTKEENPFLTQLLTGGIFIMLATLIGSRRGSSNLPSAPGPG
jgi:hypothetical protein